METIKRQTGCVRLVGHRYCLDSGCRLSLSYRLYASSVCDMNSASAVAVYGLRRYTSVICFWFCQRMEGVNVVAKHGVAFSGTIKSCLGRNVPFLSERYIVCRPIFADLIRQVLVQLSVNLIRFILSNICACEHNVCLNW